MQLLKRTEVINWAKSKRKIKLVKEIDSLPVIAIAEDQTEYVMGIQLQRAMTEQLWRQLTADVTSYNFK